MQGPISFNNFRAGGAAAQVVFDFERVDEVEFAIHVICQKALGFFTGHDIGPLLAAPFAGGSVTINGGGAPRASRRRSRPRAMRDITVPILTPETSAISL